MDTQYKLYKPRCNKKIKKLAHSYKTCKKKGK